MLEVVRQPVSTDLRIFATLGDRSPFHTIDYANACQSVGRTPYLLLQRLDGTTHNACLAMAKAGTLSKQLEIVSAPAVKDGDAFWPELVAWCRTHKFDRLIISSFGSNLTDLPSIPDTIDRKSRQEFKIDLHPDILFTKLSRSHRKNIKLAHKAGLQVRRFRDESALQSHLKLMTDSMSRRAERGEEVSMPKTAQQLCMAMIHHRCADIFQAWRDDTAISSMLVVYGNKTAYDYTSGSAPEGMRCGASPFLITEIAKILQQEDYEWFNLGGADDSEQGLSIFKERFGAIRTPLCAATVSTNSPLKKLVRRVANNLLARTDH